MMRTGHPYGLVSPSPPAPRSPERRAAPVPSRGAALRPRAGDGDASSWDDKDTVCWQCPASLDCEIARMCLAHPTSAIRLAAVIRAIQAMRAGLDERLSLTKLANAAMLSPFHFHRVFRHITATTPARYLAAMRMAEAKRLLVGTQLSITDICGAVGYASLGTFTHQFTRLVGTSPRSFRYLMAQYGELPIADLLASVAALTEPATDPAGGLVGTVNGGPSDEGGLAMLGLFDSGVPQQRPAACAIVSSPCLTAIGPIPDGIYQLLAISFVPTATVAQALADHREPVRFVGADPRPVVVRNGATAVNFDVTLRRPRYTDPPVVMAFPLLMAAQANTLSN